MPPAYRPEPPGAGTWNRTFWADHETLVEGSQEKDFMVYVARAGWPCRCMYLWTTTTSFMQPAETHGEWKFDIGSRHFGPLPVVPLWPGFAFNTLFYAGIAWTLWRTPIWLRRHRRRARGLCVKCAYSRAGLPPGSPCPECGHAPPAALSAPSA